MKILYLIRHAKSSWKHPELDDFDRPLNKRGERDAPDMGQRLADKEISPDLMLSSPANRAITTCKTIAKALDYPEEAIETNEKIYLASTSELLETVQQVDDTWNTVFLFGHNPGFTDFANRLTNEYLDNIPTCGVFVIQFDVDSWAKMGFGKGNKVFFDFPKSRS